MPNSVERVVWDACVVIDAIQKTEGRYELIEPFLLDAERGEFQIVLSEGTVGEVVYLEKLDEAGMSRPEQRRLINDWLENPYIVRRSIHPGVSRLAAELGDQYGIKRLGDRLVVATALMDGVPLLHTFDGHGNKPGLLAFDGMIGKPPLRITIPDYGDGTLFGVVDDGQGP